MSNQNEGNNRTFKAAADYSAKKYYIMKVSASNVVTLASAATDALVGILMNEPESGANADVKMRSAAGTGRVIAGGTVAVGALVTTDSAGKAIATTTDGDEVLGRAMEAAVSGDIFEISMSTERVYIA